MIYSIKDGKYSGDNTLSTAWGAAFIAGAAERELYPQKWKLQAAIADAKSLKALKAVEIKFTMADFSKKEEN